MGTRIRMTKTLLILGELLVTQEQSDNIIKLGFQILYQTKENTFDAIKNNIQKSQYIFSNNFDLDPYLKYCKHIKLIVLAATGYDWFDLNQAKNLNLSVCNLRNYSTPSVIEYIIWAAIGATKQYNKAIERVKNHNWSKTGLNCTEIYGKSAGIIGYGNVGKPLAQCLKAFGMEVNINTDREFPIAEGKWLPLNELLKKSQFLFICCSLDKNNENLLDYQKLKQLPLNAVIISITPNAIFNIDDLTHLLHTRIQTRAILDLDPLPKDHPLLNCKNVIITPHIAFLSKETIFRRTDCCIESLVHHLNKKYKKISYIY